MTVSQPAANPNGNSGAGLGSASGDPSGGGGKKSAGNGAGSGSGSGSGSGGGAGSGAGDDHDHDHDHGGPFDPDNPTAGLNTPPIQTVAGGNGRAQAFSLWYPMCLFMDPTAVSQAQGNATVKGLVDGAASCGVNLVVFPMTVAPGSYSNGDPDATNREQSAACNLIGQMDNATRASTSICVNHTQMSDKMCDQKCTRNAQGGPGPDCGPDGEHKVNTAGCAQVNSSGEEAGRVQAFIDDLNRRRNRTGNLTQAEIDDKAAAEARYQELKKDGSVFNSASSPIAPSIEDTNACTAGTVGHEALGHSMFGHPNGASDGHGIGLEKTGGGGGGWTPEGCDAMRRNAFANSGKWRWDANRTTYYVQSPRQFNLRSDKVMGPTIRPPLPTGTRPADQGGETGRVVFDDNAEKARPGPGEPAAQKTNPPEGKQDTYVAGPEGRHKGQQPGSVTGELVENLKELQDAQGGDIPPPLDGYTRTPPAPAPGNSSATRVTFDDSAKKGGGQKYTDYGTAGRIGGASYGRGPASPGGDSRTSVAFDDSAKKGGGYTNYGGGGGGGGSGGERASEGSEEAPVKIIPATVDSALGRLDGNFFSNLETAEQARRRAEEQPARRPGVVVDFGARQPASTGVRTIKR